MAPAGADGPDSGVFAIHAHPPRRHAGPWRRARCGVRFGRTHRAHEAPASHDRRRRRWTPEARTVRHPDRPLRTAREVESRGQPRSDQHKRVPPKPVIREGEQMAETSPRDRTEPVVRTEERACSPPSDRSHLGLLRDLKRVVDLDAQVPDRAFGLGVPEQQLHSSEVLRPAVDQRRLGPSDRVRAVR